MVIGDGILTPAISGKHAFFHLLYMFLISYSFSRLCFTNMVGLYTVLNTLMLLLSLYSTVLSLLCFQGGMLISLLPPLLPPECGVTFYATDLQNVRI